MKKLMILLILTFGVFFVGCEKEDEKAIKEKFKFEATVLNKGVDCGETFIISLKNLEPISDLDDGIYYADNLGAEYKEQGLKIYLNCRKPNDDEVYVCTSLGPTYPHLIVLSSSKAGESVCDQDVVISETEYEKVPNDLFTITEMQIDGDCLNIKFNASGCDGDTWTVRLIDSGRIAESYPSQRFLRLSLDSIEVCTAVISKEISFKIKDLQITGNDKVTLHVSGKGILYEY